MLYRRSQTAQNKLFEQISQNNGQQEMFSDLTIPFLRQKEYLGKLGNLTFYSENPEYKSYLTDYSSDDLVINGLLTVPIGEKPESGWPAIIFVHGYIPPSLYKTTEKYVSYIDYLAKSGYVVFKIDLRGHGKSDGEAGGAYYSSDYIIDVLNAKNALENTDFVNPGKIGLWGHSMAGNVVFRSLAVRSIPVVVIWAGAVYTYEDFRQFGLNDGSYRPPIGQTQRQKRRQELFATHGEFDANSVFWKKVVAINYLDGLPVNLQIHHAIDDNVVNIGYTRNLKQVLEEKDIKIETYEYLSGGHNITGASFNQAMDRTVKFYDRFLK